MKPTTLFVTLNCSPKAAASFTHRLSFVTVKVTFLLTSLLLLRGVKKEVQTHS